MIAEHASKLSIVKFNSDEKWLSVNEMAELTSLSKQAIHKIIKKGEFETRIVKGLGGERILIKVSSLPEFARLKYLRDNNLLPQLSTKTPDDNFDELPQAAREIALAKFDLITAWKEFRATTRLPLHQVDKVFIHKYKNKEYPEIFKKLNGKGSVGTLYRDSKLLEENDADYRVLAPGYVYGKKGPVISAKEAEALLKYIKYPTKLKVAEIVRWGMKDLKDDGMLDLRSADTYRRWVEEWKSKNYDQWILFREGQKALNDKVMFYTKREKSLLEVGDMIIIDGHTINFEIISPYPPYKPKRMILILAFDYRSDMPLGWEIMPSENKFAIASAVRRALMFLAYSCGHTDSALKGSIVNIDNGRANKSKYLLGENNKKSKWFSGNLKEQGIIGLFEKVFEGVAIAKPYHGQTKTIERFFGVLSEAERLIYTYSGTSIADKPARMLRNEKDHKRIYEKLLANVALTIDQAHYLLAQWFDEYANRPHSDGYYKGHAPKEVFFESLDTIKKLPDFETRLLHKDHLNYLMLEETVTTLYRRGIRLNGKEYFHPALYSLEKGKGKVTFRVKYDRDNTDGVLIFDDKGKFLCEATDKKTLHPLAKFRGTPEQIQEYQNQVGMQRELKQRTTSSFKDHFENAVLPELPDSIQKLEEKEAKKLEKRGKLTKKVDNDDLDFKCDSIVGNNIDEGPDYKIQVAM